MNIYQYDAAKEYLIYESISRMHEEKYEEPEQYEYLEVPDDIDKQIKENYMGGNAK